MGESRTHSFFDRVLDSFTSLEPLTRASKSVTTTAPRRFLEDPDRTTSYDVLRMIPNRARGGGLARKALANLLAESGGRDEDVDIQRVTALSNSKGRYVGNLPRLLGTITPPPDRIAALPKKEQMAMVKEQVWKELGNKVDGRFSLIEEGWSGRLIASNSGAARRFSMLHCEFRPEPLLLPSRIERFELAPDAFATLTTDYWTVILPGDAAGVFQAAAEEARVEGVEEASRTWNPGFPDDTDKNEWVVLACPTAGRRYRDFRLAVEDAAIPRFDLSHWLRLLATGRERP